MPKVEIDVPEDLISYIQEVSGLEKSESLNEICVLALKEFRERRERLKGLLQEGVDSIEKGDGVECNSKENIREFFDRISEEVDTEYLKTHTEIQYGDFSSQSETLLANCEEKRVRVMKDGEAYAILLPQSEYVRLLEIEREFTESIH